MNITLLNQYNIEFKIVRVSNKKIPVIEQSDITDLSYAISSYLSVKTSLLYLIDELLFNLDNAIQGSSFDIDGGGMVTFLEIGAIDSTFINSEISNVTIPTIDLKEIVLSWVEFLEINNLNSKKAVQ